MIILILDIPVNHVIILAVLQNPCHFVVVAHTHPPDPPLHRGNCRLDGLHIAIQQKFSNSYTNGNNGYFIRHILTLNRHHSSALRDAAEKHTTRLYV